MDEVIRALKEIVAMAKRNGYYETDDVTGVREWHDSQSLPERNEVGLPRKYPTANATSVVMVSIGRKPVILSLEEAKDLYDQLGYAIERLTRQW